MLATVNLLGRGGELGLSLVALLLVYRYARTKLRAVGAVRQALLAMKQGESGLAALEVSQEFGPEGVAWNELLDEKEQLH